MTEHLSNDARKVLAETGLHLRALEILGVRSHTEVTGKQYAEALIASDNEGAGRAYVDAIAEHAGVRATREIDHSEAVHRSAVGYLQAIGKKNYTADEYVAAVSLVESTKS